MNELTIDGKIYISSKKAAEITGYAKDYIGQLCREGHVEARMVGRSWYVLESSIRAHRFGVTSHAESVQVVPETSSTLDTWEKPTYAADPVSIMPVPLIEKPENAESAPVRLDTPSTTAETLTDMQAAWKEWFAQKQDHLIESPEIIDAREAEHEVQAVEDYIEASEEAIKPQEADEEPVSIVPMHVMPENQPEYEAEGEIEPESEPVLIHRTPAVIGLDYEEEVIPTKQERKKARAQKNRVVRNNYMGPIVIRALLIAIIGITIAVTVISSGYADRFHIDTQTSPIFRFLGGTSIYTK